MYIYIPILVRIFSEMYQSTMLSIAFLNESRDIELVFSRSTLLVLPSSHREKERGVDNHAHVLILFHFKYNII